VFKKRHVLFVYAAIALILIWSGAGWIITELGKLDVPPTAPVLERYNQFIMLHGISMVLIGAYIMLKNIIFRDSIIY
jgi:hypothetical protein